MVEKLSVEALAHVLGFLPFSDRLAVAKVSPLWLDAAQFPTSWTSLDTSYESLIKSDITQWRCVRELTVYNVISADEAATLFTFVNEVFPSLRVLRVGSTTDPEWDLPELVKRFILEGHPRSKPGLRIIVINCPLDWGALAALAPLLSLTEVIVLSALVPLEMLDKEGQGMMRVSLAEALNSISPNSLVMLYLREKVSSIITSFDRSLASDNFCVLPSSSDDERHYGRIKYFSSGDQPDIPHARDLILKPDRSNRRAELYSNGRVEQMNCFFLQSFTVEEGLCSAIGMRDTTTTTTTTSSSSSTNAFIPHNTEEELTPKISQTTKASVAARKMARAFFDQRAAVGNRLLIQNGNVSSWARVLDGLGDEQDEVIKILIEKQATSLRYLLTPSLGISYEMFSLFRERCTAIKLWDLPGWRALYAQLSKKEDLITMG